MTPKKIILNKNKRSIQVEYENNTYLLLTSSYLRACSPSAENKSRLRQSKDTKTISSYFSKVLINRIESVGNYAVRIIFNDGHDTGIFSWNYLHDIGSKVQDS